LLLQAYPENSAGTLSLSLTCKSSYLHPQLFIAATVVRNISPNSMHILREHIRNYLLLAFGISYIAGTLWMFLLNPIDSTLGLEHQPISLFVLKFGPSIAGLIVCRVYGGHKKTVALLKSGLHIIVPWNVIIVSILVPIVGMAISITIWNTEMVLPIFTWSFLWALLPVLTIKIFLGGGFGEEFGWRGYMQPVLQTKHSWVTASTIIAFFWILWHLPSIFIGGEFGNPIIIIITLSGYSIILAWIYNSSGGSIFWAALFHGLANAVSNTVESQIGEHFRDIETNINLTYAIFIAGVAIVLIILHRDTFKEKSIRLTTNNKCH